MRAKLVNGHLEYFQQPKWILGDATAYAAENGYKEVIHKTGNNGSYEQEGIIVIETPKPKPLPTNSQRQQAYSSEFLVNWNGELHTCDYCRDLMLTYKKSEQTEKYKQLKTDWLAARARIQEKYPEIA